MATCELMISASGRADSLRDGEGFDHVGLPAEAIMVARLPVMWNEERAAHLRSTRAILQTQDNSPRTL